MLEEIDLSDSGEESEEHSTNDVNYYRVGATVKTRKKMTIVITRQIFLMYWWIEHKELITC